MIRKVGYGPEADKSAKGGKLSFAAEANVRTDFLGYKNLRMKIYDRAMWIWFGCEPLRRAGK
jgi:hypothetical protein